MANDVMLVKPLLTCPLASANVARAARADFLTRGQRVRQKIYPGIACFREMRIAHDFQDERCDPFEFFVVAVREFKDRANLLLRFRV